MDSRNDMNYNEKANRKGKGKRGGGNNYSGYYFNPNDSNYSGYNFNPSISTHTSTENMKSNFHPRETSEAVRNVRYGSQDQFLESFGYNKSDNDNLQKSNNIYPPLPQYENVIERENSLPMETNEADESVGAQVPIPAPRQSVKNKNKKENTSVTNEVTNGGNRGSKPKSKGKKDSDNSSVLFCITCEKAVTQPSIHNGHHVAPYQNGIEGLQEKEINKLSATVKEAKHLMKSEMQTKDMINLWDSGMDESLQVVFKKYETSSSQNIDRLLKVIDEGNKIINNAQQTKISNLLQLIDLRTCSSPVISEAQQSSSLQDKPLWLLINWFKVTLALLIQSGKQIVAFSQMNSGSQFAPFELQGDRLLLYSFRKNFKLDEDTFVVPFDSVNCLFECNDFFAFMKISYNNKLKGCLFMRLDKESFWGNQFMTLCSGEIGPSLRNTRFFRSCWKNKPGHHVWGGDYTRNDGSGGEAFFKWNGALVNGPPQPIIKGLIASRPGVGDRSSIFRIYLKGEDPKMRKSNDIEMNDKFGFGHVIDGLDVLEHVADLSDISKSKIEDTGRFIVLT